MAGEKEKSYPLMESVSGVRGIAGKSFNDELVYSYASAFAKLQLKEHSHEISGKRPFIVVGKDSRISGPSTLKVVSEALTSAGVDVLYIGTVPTPTVQIITEKENALGGIIITSSHNPIEWNGLKFVDTDGLFIFPEKFKLLKELKEQHSNNVQSNSEKGTVTEYSKAIQVHIDSILNLDYINPEAVRKRGFKVCLDTVNGAGGTIMKRLLESFGCTVIGLNLEETGQFAHEPEPIPANLKSLCERVKQEHADFGIAVDPDVDRCVLIDETGNPLSEEYTLALAVEFLLGPCGKRGAVVKNLSSTRAIDDIAKKYGCPSFSSAVGEINVAVMMKQQKAIIGGEGNGGVMLPDIHIGRDAPVAAALTLQHLALYDCTISELKKKLPLYEICKLKAPIAGIDPKLVVSEFKKKYEHFAGYTLNDIDGLRIDGPEWWVHLRESNTEPIIRVIGEAGDYQASEKLCTDILKEIEQFRSRC